MDRSLTVAASMRGPLLSTPKFASRDEAGDAQGGGSPLVGGAGCLQPAWGEPSHPGFPPEGETGKGESKLLAAAGYFPLLRSPTAETPCFHPHSFWSFHAPVPFGVLN